MGTLCCLMALVCGQASPSRAPARPPAARSAPTRTRASTSAGPPPAEIGVISEVGASREADPATNTRAIQAAIDAVIQRTGGTDHGPSGVILVPDATYTIDRPLWLDAPHIGIQGQGPNATLQM